MALPVPHCPPPAPARGGFRRVIAREASHVLVNPPVRSSGEGFYYSIPCTQRQGGAPQGEYISHGGYNNLIVCCSDYMPYLRVPPEAVIEMTAGFNACSLPSCRTTMPVTCQHNIMPS